MQVCSICGKPLEGKEHPGAEVCHMSCAMQQPELVKYREEMREVHEKELKMRKK